MASPRWLFLYPGIFLMVLGLAGSTWLLPGPRRTGDLVFDVHTLLYALMSIPAGLPGDSICSLHKKYLLFQKAFCPPIHA